jgi:hypothetical protein
MENQIQLLQFLICEKFQQQKQDAYAVEAVLSNLYVANFPYYFTELYVVTCWRKDQRFHKEVIEYATDYGTSLRSPHMDIEPLKDSVLFRWHTHRFPTDFAIEKPTTLTIRVILDWKIQWESYLLIELKPT